MDEQMDPLNPRRKQLRLKEYDYSQPGSYFVTVCTHERQCLFSSYVGAHLCVRPHEESNFIVRWMLELEKKYPGITMDSVCVMPDHVHMIIEITGAHIGAPLPEIIKWYKTQTTNEYIRKVRAGELLPYEKHVWQRGYYEYVIRNEAELNEIRQYIENNPQKLEEEAL